MTKLDELEKAAKAELIECEQCGSLVGLDNNGFRVPPLYIEDHRALIKIARAAKEMRQVFYRLSLHSNDLAPINAFDEALASLEEQK